MKISDKGGKDFAQVPQGTHLAICNMVVSLGMQETPYGNKEQLYIRFELPQERIEYEKDGKKIEAPMSIGAFYTASLSEKANLRRDLEGWRGRAFTKDELEGFEIFNVLGTCCQVNVTHNEHGKARIVGVSGWPKGMDKPSPENPLIKYDDENEEQFDQIPEWLQDIIKKQLRKDEPEMNQDAPFNDSIPF